VSGINGTGGEGGRFVIAWEEGGFTLPNGRAAGVYLVHVICSVEFGGCRRGGGTIGKVELIVIEGESIVLVAKVAKACSQCTRRSGNRSLSAGAKLDIEACAVLHGYQVVALGVERLVLSVLLREIDYVFIFRIFPAA
jgi:hypothetical protein